MGTILEDQQVEEGPPTNVAIPGSDKLMQASWSGPAQIPAGATALTTEKLADRTNGVRTNTLSGSAVRPDAVGTAGAPVPSISVPTLMIVIATSPT